MPTAHFKLLQHPLRKTKGSVLLSTVKYTHPPPSSTSALPQSSQPDTCSSLTPEQPSWTMESWERGEVHSSASPIAQERGFLPGTRCLRWSDVNPTLAMDPKLVKEEAALIQHTGCVDSQWVLPASCWYFHTSFFSWLPTSYSIPGKATFTGNPSASNLPPLVYVYKAFCTVSFAWKIGYVIKESY